MTRPLLEARDVRLYLDLPVGTSGDGYDTWADHDLYAWGCGVGAPPDDFFGAGQNWGFPPVSPIAARAQDRPVQIYVGFAPGGNIDLAARMAGCGHPFILGTECDTLHVPEHAATIRAKVDCLLGRG